MLMDGYIMKVDKIAGYLRYTARTVLLALGILVFIFSLVSGSEQLGGGIEGIILNSPNAIPWAFLLGFILIAWRWELIGGSLIILMGLFTLFFFRGFEHPFVLFVITIPLIVFGSFFIISWYLTKKHKQKKAFK